MKTSASTSKMRVKKPAVKKPVFMGTGKFKRDDILKIIGDGTFCTVWFLKANGEVRTMNCRTNVKKYLKGVGKRFSDEDYEIVTVWDTRIREYRSFKAERVLAIKAHGKIFK